MVPSLSSVKGLLAGESNIYIFLHFLYANLSCRVSYMLLKQEKFLILNHAKGSCNIWSLNQAECRHVIHIVNLINVFST